MKKDLTGPFLYLNQNLFALKTSSEKRKQGKGNRSAIHALRLLRFEICKRRNDSDHVLSKN